MKKIFKNKKNNSKIEDEPNEKDIPKEIGSYHDFLVFEKSDQNTEKNYYFDNYKNDNPFLSDWLILKSNPKKTKSRFADLFQEIMENDRKAALEEQNKPNFESNQQQSKINNINNDKNNNINNNINNNNINNNINNNSINYNNNNNNFNSNINKNPNLNNKINLNNNINNKINLNNNTNNIINLNNNNINKINLEQIKEVDNDINYSVSNQLMDNNIIYNNKYIKEDNNLDLISNSRKSILNKEQKLPKHKSSLYSNASSNFGLSTNDSDYFGSLLSSNNNLLSYERDSIVEKNSQLLVDLRRIILLEDRRTSLMIKNIPNKFSGELLLNIINQNFKGAYNIFILPTDSNKYKNFGYAFINFNCCYYIPYFYYLFNGKMWSSTNSQKICEITYSKIQGKKNLINHYQNKIIFQNDSFKNNSELKFIVPNDYKFLFKQGFPHQFIEEYKYYFITKLPNKK